MPEDCENGIDDDGDGLIDLNDDDCSCEIVTPKSLIPNPSFEDMSCCPNGRSQLRCAEGWIQASAPTTDLINTCDWLGWEDFPAPMPFPDGNGIMGFRDGRTRGFGEGDSTPEYNWKEYAGACLLEPLLAGTTYRFQFDLGFVDPGKSPPINVTFFGTPDCKHLPFGNDDDSFGCPTNGPNWVRLGSTFVRGSTDSWIESYIEVTPEEDVYAIAIGPDCPAVVSPVNIYYFFDNLILADFESFALKITEEEHPCSETFTLGIEDGFFSNYQWYKDGIALVGETRSKLSKIYGDGNYQIRVLQNQSCRLSEGYMYEKPIVETQSKIIICNDETYQFGDTLLSESGQYTGTFKSVNNCDSIVSLELVELGVLRDTIQGKIFKDEKFEIAQYDFKEEGEHLATLSSSLGCDSLVLVQLEYYNVYIPNIFSPVDDGLDSTFKIYAPQGVVDYYELMVFDLWGNKIYTGQEWDGTLNNKRLQAGAYSYLLQIKMEDGIERTFNGSISLIR